MSLTFLKFCIDNKDIPLKGGVSENFDLFLSFYFMSKSGQLLVILKTFFLDCIRYKLGPR